MAFAAVVSVERILQQLLHSDNLFSCDDCPISDLEIFHLKIQSLQSSLENIYPVRRSIRDEVNELESKIRDAVYKTQDLIEAFISQPAFLQNMKEKAEKLDRIIMAATAENDGKTTSLAAVVSVEQILQQLLHSDIPFPYDGFPKSGIESFLVKIRSLQPSLENKYENELESQIRATVRGARDLIEAFISSQTPQSTFLENLKENAKKLEEVVATKKKIADSMKKEQLQTSWPSSANAPTFKSSRASLAAVVSVEQILQQLLHSDIPFPYDGFPKSGIESFLVKIRSLQPSLENKYENELESQIRATVCEARDLIEAFISSTPSTFLENLKENAKKLEEVVATAKKIADSMKKEQLQTSWPSSANAPTSKSSRASESSKIVGQDEDLKKLREQILKDTPNCQVISITGLAGIGKTTLARSIYEDKQVVDRFTIRSWVTVGQEYNAGEIFSKLLASIESKGQKSDGSESTKISHGNAEQLAVQLYNSLLDSRYLIIVDDVWDTNVWDRIKNYFPKNKYCSRIVVTTRIDKIVGQLKSDFTHLMQLLSKEKSWELLREKVFGGGHCPPNLVITGTSIAEHCGGLPLSITVVGGQLSQEMKNVEYWTIVEDDTEAAARSNKETYVEILSRSYEHLPARLKGCFLYMGAFPEDSEIPVSKLVKLWVAEGFLLQTESSSLENYAEQCLIDLVDRNLIFPLKFSSNGKIKTCSMHDSIRLLAETKCDEESFFVSLKKFPSQRKQPREEVRDTLKGKESRRRLSVHKNILMCMEDVYKSAKSIKPARTLLYAGQYHHHPLPFCLTYDLIRVLDALAVHLIEFPNELVELIHLRYLSVTYNGQLPASLAQLKNLLVLIVSRHPNIIIMRKSFLPVEIWYMKQLRHILLTECDFPHLPEIQAGNSPLLENLQSLSNINAAPCTEEFFKNMPNLKKLGVWIEAPGPDPVNIYLKHLPDLEAFKFTVLNPIPGRGIKFQESFVFPKRLKKLSLSGCGLPWDYMANIGEFPCLQVLKLRQFAFQGLEWIPEEAQFPELKLLLIECLDLEYLAVGFFCCENLETLIIKNCYELEEIDEKLMSIGTLKHVELVGCNYAAVKCVEEMREKLSGGGKDLPLRVYSSWGEESSKDGMEAYAHASLS